MEQSGRGRVLGRKQSALTSHGSGLFRRIIASTSYPKWMFVGELGSHVERRKARPASGFEADSAPWPGTGSVRCGGPSEQGEAPSSQQGLQARGGFPG